MYIIPHRYEHGKLHTNSGGITSSFSNRRSALSRNVPRSLLHQSQGTNQEDQSLEAKNNSQCDHSFNDARDNCRNPTPDPTSSLRSRSRSRRSSRARSRSGNTNPRRTSARNKPLRLISNSEFIHLRHERGLWNHRLGLAEEGIVG